MATNQAVSKMLEIKDGYTAFCIDEAASFVISKLNSGAKPLIHSSNRETAEFLKKGGW